MQIPSPCGDLEVCFAEERMLNSTNMACSYPKGARSRSSFIPSPITVATAISSRFRRSDIRLSRETVRYGCHETRALRLRYQLHSYGPSLEVQLSWRRTWPKNNIGACERGARTIAQRVGQSRSTCTSTRYEKTPRSSASEHCASEAHRKIVLELLGHNQPSHTHEL